MPKTLREQITYFFLHYKDLEPNKWYKLNLWDDWDDAAALTEQAIAQQGA